MRPPGVERHPYKDGSRPGLPPVDALQGVGHAAAPTWGVAVGVLFERLSGCNGFLELLVCFLVEAEPR